MQSLFTRDRLLSLVGAPVIWTAHFVVCYVVVSLACAYRETAPQLFGLNPVDIGVGAATMLGLLLIGYIALLNMRKWQRERSPKSGVTSMSAFFALTSLLLCALSAVALTWVAFPALILPPCAA